MAELLTADLTVAHYVDQLTGAIGDLAANIDRLDGGVPSSGTAPEPNPVTITQQMARANNELNTLLERVRIVANALGRVV